MPIPPAFFNQSRARRPAKPGLRALLYPIRRSLSAPISSTYCFNILCCGYLVDHSLPSLSAPGFARERCGGCGGSNQGAGFSKVEPVAGGSRARKQVACRVRIFRLCGSRNLPHRTAWARGPQRDALSKRATVVPFPTPGWRPDFPPCALRFTNTGTFSWSGCRATSSIGGTLPSARPSRCFT